MGDTILIETTADEVVSIVTAGPQGPSGAEAATLTTQGDTLYRGLITNQRLPIGSPGQVLKVNSGATAPEWANESGAVTEVNGQTGAVTLTAADVGAAFALSVVNAGTLAGDVVLTANRNRLYTYNVLFGGPYNITLPIANNQSGDTVQIQTGPTFVGSVVIRQQNHDGSSGSPQFTTLATLVGSSPTIPQSYSFIKTTNSDYGSWAVLSVDTHTHAAADITSGTLAHERGGLEADVSAYSGLVKIASGSTSAVTVTAAGEALLDDATNADQRTTLGLGTAAVANLGTGASDAAYGNHTHADLHTRSHAITSTSDHTAGNHKVFYSDGAGSIVELALGNSGEVLTSNGATSAPSFAAASGGDTVSIDATAADVLTATSGAISADDGGTIDSADPFIKWDDAAGKLVYANPLSRPSGAFYVGLAPTTTAIGTNSITISGARSNAICVASGTDAIAIGLGARATGTGSIAIGNRSTRADSLASNTIVIGEGASSNNNDSVAIGRSCVANVINGAAIGNEANAALRGGFGTRPFNAIYWGGSTNNATPLILNLDAAATNRFTIAANTALAVDILLVARRSDVADKWLVARRFLGIRRDGSNNTSLIGSVQTLGTDQSDGSPSWSFALTADDTNEALQLEVTGAASETVQWRATAFYRVV